MQQFIQANNSSLDSFLSKNCLFAVDATNRHQLNFFSIMIIRAQVIAGTPFQIASITFITGRIKSNILVDACFLLTEQNSIIYTGTSILVNQESTVCHQSSTFSCSTFNALQQFLLGLVFHCAFYAAENKTRKSLAWVEFHFFSFFDLCSSSCTSASSSMQARSIS